MGLARFLDPGGDDMKFGTTASVAAIAMAISLVGGGEALAEGGKGALRLRPLSWVPLQQTLFIQGWTTCCSMRR